MNSFIVLTQKSFRVSLQQKLYDNIGRLGSNIMWTYTLKTEAVCSSEMLGSTSPHSLTSQKTNNDIFTTMCTWSHRNLNKLIGNITTQASGLLLNGAIWKLTQKVLTKLWNTIVNDFVKTSNHSSSPHTVRIWKEMFRSIRI